MGKEPCERESSNLVVNTWQWSGGRVVLGIGGRGGVNGDDCAGGVWKERGPGQGVLTLHVRY